VVNVRCGKTSSDCSVQRPDHPWHPSQPRYTLACLPILVAPSTQQKWSFQYPLPASPVASSEFIVALFAVRRHPHSPLYPPSVTYLAFVQVTDDKLCLGSAPATTSAYKTHT
jgi:hypothetical protein